MAMNAVPERRRQLTALVQPIICLRSPRFFVRTIGVPTTLPLTPVQAYAPDFARRFCMIMTALAALIARRLLRDPRLIALIVPLCNRINRAARRFERLVARLTAGKPSKPRRPGHRGGPHSSLFPRGRFWLIGVLGYEGAGYASQLAALLAEPGAAALLAEVPAAGRILRPIARMLAIGATQRPVRPKPAAKPSLEFIPPGPLAFRSHGYTWYEVPTPPLKPGRT